MMNEITKHDMMLPDQLASILATFVSCLYDEMRDIDNEIFDAVMGWYCLIQDDFCSRADIRLYEVLCAIAEKIKEHYDFMKSDKKKIITVNIPADLLDIIDQSLWHNRSKLISDALEEYIACHDPGLYKLLEVMRNA